MGCSSSRLHSDNDELLSENTNILTSKLEKLVKSKRPDDLLIAYIYLEKNISQEENVSPPAIYGEALSRLHQINTLLQMAHEDKSNHEFFSQECSLEEVFTDLGVKNAKIAAEHEEFIARINRRALNQNTIKIWEREKKIVEDLITKSSSRIKSLQNAYHYQEELLGRIFGRSYESETEKLLEKEVDRMRYYRDMLYIGILQWEACIERVAAAYGLAKAGVSSWITLANQPMQKKMKLTTAARDCLHEAILLIQSSDELLTDVQFPYCTTRELKGVLQALDYVFTDILIYERYLHATEVYKNLLERASLLDGWMKQILESKMKKDFLEIEDKISDLAKRLKNERVELIKKKLNHKGWGSNMEERLSSIGLEVENLEETTRTKTGNSFQTKTVVSDEMYRFPMNFDSKLGPISPLGSQKANDVINYFHNLIESRKMTMWPSRRIDELQSLLVQH